MGDVLERVDEAVGKVVGRVDAPLFAGARVLGELDAVGDLECFFIFDCGKEKTKKSEPLKERKSKKKLNKKTHERTGSNMFKLLFFGSIFSLSVAAPSAMFPLVISANRSSDSCTGLSRKGDPSRRSRAAFTCSCVWWQTYALSFLMRSTAMSWSLPK